MAAVRPDADAVDARPARDRDAPAAVRAGAQHGERVVADGDALGPSEPGDRVVEAVLLLGEVEPREHEACGPRDRAVGAGEPGHPDGLGEQAVQQRHGAVEPDVVRRAERPADEREQRAVRPDEREVGLRVAAVDREGQRIAHRRRPGDALIP